jgi:hypothetical protein
MMIFRALTILLIAAGMSAYGEQAVSEEQVSESATAPVPPAVKFKDSGDFKPVYYETATYLEMEKAFREEMIMEVRANALNESLALPFDISIGYGECGEANAAYNPEKRAIIVCYEYLNLLIQELATISRSQEELERNVDGAELFTFYHELGHALIHALRLPAVGREEDAADQLASYVLLELGEEGEEHLVRAANAFYLLHGRVSRLAYADEHSMGKQRYFNIMCWVYGRAPDRNSTLVSPKLLPAQRAERCPNEYQQMKSAWDVLLAPYLK